MLLAKQVSEKLAACAEDIAQHLFPNGQKHGNEWCVGSISGEPGNSMKIHLSGSKAGVWCDFATGEKGDLLDLWAIKRNLSTLEAIKDSSSYIGIGSMEISPVIAPKFVKPHIKPMVLATSSEKVRFYLINVRHLTKEILDLFQIKANGDEIVYPYFGQTNRNTNSTKLEPIFVKYLKVDRVSGKKQIRIESNCQPCLFGWHLIGNSRKVILCEGEIDAMTISQYGFPALSVPFGGGTGNKHKWIEYEYENLMVFDEIYLCMDNDAEGKAAANEIAERLGRFRCRLVTLPFKDANECLINGLSKEDFIFYLKKATTCDPDGLKNASVFEEEFVKECFYPDESKKGYQSPWGKSQDNIRFRPNELSIWTGINGHGKSQFLGQVILDLMTQGARVCVASLELRPFKFLKRLTIQATAMRNFSENYARHVLQWYAGKLWLVSLTKKEKANAMMDMFDYAHKRYGIDVFVIDPFTKLSIAQDDYKKQTEFIEELCDFKERNNCHVHLVVHPRKSENEAANPNKMDIKGTGAITDLADNVFVVWRNKEKENIKTKQKSGIILTDKESQKLLLSDVLWRCDKQRDEDGGEGVFGFYFDNDSLQYLENENYQPKRYVEYP